MAPAGHSLQPGPGPKPASGTLQVLAAGEGCRAGVSRSNRELPRHWPAACRAAALARFCNLVAGMAEADVGGGSGTGVAACGGGSGTGEKDGSVGGGGGESGRKEGGTRCPPWAASRVVLQATQAAARRGADAGSGADGSSEAASLWSCSYGDLKRVCGGDSVKSSSSPPHLAVCGGGDWSSGGSGPLIGAERRGGVSGGWYLPAWSVLRQAPSPFANRWIDKPTGHLDCLVGDRDLATPLQTRG